MERLIQLFVPILMHSITLQNMLQLQTNNFNLYTNIFYNRVKNKHEACRSITIHLRRFVSGIFHDDPKELLSSSIRRVFGFIDSEGIWMRLMISLKRTGQALSWRRSLMNSKKLYLERPRNLCRYIINHTPPSTRLWTPRTSLK